MKIAANQSGNVRKLCFDGEFTILHIPRTKETMLKHLNACAGLEIDLTKVSEIDTSGVQLLILAAQEARRNGKTFKIGALSSAANELIGLYRLDDFLE